MFMAEKIAYTIKRHLTTNAQLVAQELIDTYGSMKSVLSAAVFALKNSSPEQREKAFSDATKKNEKQPADLHTAIQSVVKVVTGQGTDIKMLPEEENKIVDFIVKTLGPKEHKIPIKHKTAQ